MSSKKLLSSHALRIKKFYTNYLIFIKHYISHIQIYPLYSRYNQPLFLFLLSPLFVLDKNYTVCSF